MNRSHREVLFMVEHGMTESRYDAAVKLGVVGEVSTVTGTRIMFLTDKQVALDALEAYTSMHLADIRSTIDKALRRRRRI